MICQGNICRSPFGERHLAAQCPHLDVRSAGLKARDGDPVETMDVGIAVVNMAQELLAKMGSDRMAELIQEGVPARTLNHMMRSLL